MRKLLLADDSITIQKIVDLTFADDGFAVTVIGDGEQAIEKLSEIMPDIVLADVFMPGKSGYEVCAYIKGDERFQHIPVMLLVGSFEPYNEAEARRVGANDVLTKPFQSIRQLVGKVGALLSGDSGKQAEDQNEEQRAASASSLSTPTSETSHGGEAYRASIDKFQNDSQPDGAATPSAFSDLSLDDAMIEVTPAQNFGNRHDDATARDTMPLSPTEMREVTSAADTAKHDEKPQREEFPSGQNSNIPETHNTGDETLMSVAPMETPSHVAEGDNNEAMNETESSNSSSQATGAAASDDSLLDLGDLASPSAAAAEADDFILDLRDQFNAAPTANASTTRETAPPPSSSSPNEAATLADLEEEVIDAAPQTLDYTEAQNVGEEERTNFALVDEHFAEQTETKEPSQTSFTDAPEPAFDAAAPHVENASSPAAYGEVAVPQWNSANTHTSADVSETSAQIEPSPQSGETALNQLSPEVIDQIARRVVEHLSEKVVREIAWEVVPQLAELMIKRRLEEERSQTT